MIIIICPIIKIIAKKISKKNMKKYMFTQENDYGTKMET